MTTLSSAGPATKQKSASYSLSVPFQIKQLVEAVFFIHQKGICHRDIKPDNLMLTNRRGVRTLVLIDFGVASFYDTMLSVSGTAA